MSEPQKRGPGRPKKGKPSWKPASQMDLTKAPDGHRPKWVDRTDPMNIARHQAEGWVIVNPDQGIHAEHARPDGVQDGRPLTSTTEHREMILMALPEDLAQARAEYIAELTRQQTVTVGTKIAQDKLDQAASQHGASRATATGFVKHNTETID